MECMQELLGKGRIHAGIVYEQIFRLGKVNLLHPAFSNAQALVESMLSFTDFSYPQLVQEKTDGRTDKFLLRTKDQLEIESVLIPMQAGGTLCISSQIGCRMGCAFCETGRMGLLRNLTTEEIISQVFVARHVLGMAVRNIVFMGMGEPFDNYDAVMKAVRVLRDPKGFAFGRRHITISTSGCVEGIKRLTHEKDGAPNLAVSINAPDDSSRNRLMPINRKHDMQDLYQEMHNYCTVTGQKILIAYVMLKGHNDLSEHAEKLAQYLRGLNVKINLIPYNPQSKDRFAPSDEDVLNEFAKKLRSLGYQTLVRTTKGRPIMAGCGQLGNLELKKLRNTIVG